MGHGSAKNEGNQSKKNTGGCVPTCTQKREFLHNPTPHPTTPFTQEALLYPASVPPSLNATLTHPSTAYTQQKKKRGKAQSPTCPNSCLASLHLMRPQPSLDREKDHGE